MFAATAVTGHVRAWPGVLMAGILLSACRGLEPRPEARPIPDAPIREERAAPDEPWRAAYHDALQARGFPYRSARDRLLGHSAAGVEEFLRERAAASDGPEERVLCEAWLARLRDPDGVTRAERALRDASLRAARVSLSAEHGPLRPDDVELASTMMVLVPELLTRPPPGGGTWDALSARTIEQVRLPAYPDWLSLLHEVIVFGWTFDEHPTPPPRDPDATGPMPPDTRPWQAPIIGPPAPNGDVHVLHALQTAAALGSRLACDRAVAYARARHGYGLRQRAAVHAVGLSGCQEMANPLLDLAEDRTVAASLRSSALIALEHLGSTDALARLEILGEEAEPGESDRLTSLALQALEVARRIRLANPTTPRNSAPTSDD